MPEIIDTHCHLTEPPLVGSLDEVLRRSRESGVVGVVAVSYDVASWDAVAEASRRPGVVAAYGVHPWVAATGVDRDELSRALDRPGTVAVGEVGLDFEIDGADRGRQEEALRLQLEVAAERDLPVVLHCRGAFESLLSLLVDLGDRRPRGVVHAWSRSPDIAQRFLDLGFHVGFAGTITNPRARRARTSAAVLPLDRVVVETDAPSIGLDGVDRAAVEPRHARDVAEALAHIRGTDLETVARSTTENARRLFRLDPT
jgi:TatD DNase family protein